MAIITGTSGNDTLTGTTGSDRITGGAGVDTLNGNGGADFYVDTAAGLNGDTITYFGVGDHFVFTDIALNQVNLALIGNTLSYTGGSLTITDYAAGRLVVNAAAGGGIDVALRGAAENDFNGDGRSDILWRNVDGSLSNWLSNSSGGFANNDGAAFRQVPVAWQIAGTGDFDGDGVVDLLWRNTNGALSNWLGNDNGSATPNDANAFRSVGTDWNVVSTGDFNGDGRDDILWRNDNGTVSNWLGTTTGGFAVNDANASRLVTNDWKVAGSADFNGDGIEDLLWRNDNGQLSNWLGTESGGFVVNDAAAATAAPTSWKVAGTGDFNGDGREDILWRNDNGALSNWLANANGSFTANDSRALSQVPTNWSVVATGDYNGDAIDDILWRNSSGGLSNWLGVEGTGAFAVNDANAFNQVATAWHVQPEPFTV